MSLAQLQAAAAYLVRFPEKGRGDEWQSFLSQYDMTEAEIAQLHHVAHSEQVAKYGKKLRRFRYVDAADALPTPEVVLGAELFETLWFDHFEAVAAGVPTEDLAHEFLRFLNEDAAARALIAEQAPPYAFEVLQFCYYQTSLEHRRDEWLNRSVPQGSLLTHAAIVPLMLSYDVPKAMKKEGDDPFKKMRRSTKPFYYVLLLRPDREESSLFAIDKSVYDFFNAQLTQPSSATTLPAVYADLVAAGICKAV